MASGDADSGRDPREQLIHNGWKQGAVIDFENAQESITASIINGSIKPKHQAKLLVISQDCDILSHEAHVECLLLKKVSKEAPSQKNGHNPRKIQLDPIDDIFWEARADDIVYLKKDFLLKVEPLSDFDVSNEQLNVLKQWKANRYVRTGLPELFVERAGHFFKPPRGDGEDESLENSELFSRLSKYISSIRVYCLEDGDITKCGFILLYKSLLCSADRVDVDDIEQLFEECLLDKIRTLDKTELINDDSEEGSLFEVHSLSDVMSDMEFPTGLLSLFPRYYFDYVSFGDEEDDSDLSEG
ncbi:hypothetical protein [Vibrio sp. Hep-1b-8]|uniref:hypothetical protein n=1 Tax=Vibrio sp. Hep-1b-8 TaxID=2144187 RepID=UPI001110464C|nr:hypothetical protein [Vibrio sp. Hep-1b-8]TMX34632.1 hypothetical protein DA100_15525 [Vibrio sp. Hep-1b-8]